MTEEERRMRRGGRVKEIGKYLERYEKYHEPRGERAKAKLKKLDCYLSVDSFSEASWGSG